MLDPESGDTSTTGTTDTTGDSSAGSAPATAPKRRRTTKAAAAADAAGTADSGDDAAQAPAPAKRTRKKAAAKAPADTVSAAADAAAQPAAESGEGDTPAPRKRTRRKVTTAVEETESAAHAVADDTPLPALTTAAEERSGVPSVLFKPPEPVAATPRKRTAKKAVAKTAAGPEAPEAPAADDAAPAASDEAETAETAEGAEGEAGDRPPRRRRGRRGGRGRGGGATAEDVGDEGTTTQPSDGERPAADDEADADADESEAAEGADEGGEGTGTSSSARRRRRRRRRRTDDGTGTEEGGAEEDGGVETVVHVREPRPAKKAPAAKTTSTRSRSSSSSRGSAADDDGVRGVKGSTRLEAKRQRRRDGRDTGRRRPPIITEAEFLARRESVERIMVVRQTQDRTQIAVLEDGILVEHYVARKDQTSMVGNVYLGKVQNVLPSMEAAFVDIGRGRNAVLYAGEVNYDASALEGRPPRIEQALKSGQSVLVQVTKDPIGHKGSRLTSQVSLPGRYMVYVPDGRLSGISRKLPDTERTRLKTILKRLTPDDAGVIIRTAAEGASEEELERDLNRLHAQWQDIEKKTQTASAPSLIYSEPDVVVRVIRDIFNEDFAELVVSGDDEWETVDNYVRWVAPDLAERTRKWADDEDIFAAYRVDEQLAKALDRKVNLPSGGSLVIDRTEAMVVVDVNTGKFTGKGGNLEETVTKNNIEAAEEIVRQLRLRDLGGIIVIDFIDMVLESNRDLVLRRLMECLGRDRTRHQVAEVTSLGLVQMTRKRVGQGLLEAFSETCKECGGRGVILTHDPVVSKRPAKQRNNAGFQAVAAASKARHDEAPSEAEPAAPEQPAVAAVEQPAAERSADTVPAAAAEQPAAAAEQPANGELPVGDKPATARRSRGGRGRSGAASRPAGPPTGVATRPAGPPTSSREPVAAGETDGAA